MMQIVTVLASIGYMMAMHYNPVQGRSNKFVASGINYENPVRTAVEDEITELPGLNDVIDFRQYSGYLNADTEGEKFHHYWFVESSQDPVNSPIVLWLNGGPGCSSMEGLLAELGPFEIKEDGISLKLRQYNWNKMANILFMESPIGVGYSYSTGYVKLIDDDTTAFDNYLALKSFFKKFPQYQNNPLYLAGESYAGVYLPMLGVLVDKDPDLNLKGISIGNGYLDSKKIIVSSLFFSYYHGLVGQATWNKLTKFCCNGNTPTRKNCDFDHPKSEDCLNAIVDIYNTAIDLNPYNIYADCAKHSIESELEGKSFSRDQVDRELMRQDFERFFGDRNSSSNSINGLKKLPMKELKVSMPCIDSHLITNYLNQASVRAALHVPDKLDSWRICSDIGYVRQYAGAKDGLAPQVKQLIESERKLKIIIYNGDVDLVCNFLGDEWFVDDLGRKLLKDYSAWKVGKQIGGYVKHYDGIAFVTVRGSGHMVPQDRSKEAFSMFERFLGGCHETIF